MSHYLNIARNSLDKIQPLAAKPRITSHEATEVEMAFEAVRTYALVSIAESLEKIATGLSYRGFDHTDYVGPQRARDL